VIEFPELHSGALDAAGLRALVADLEACAERLQVIPKAAARGYAAPANVPLRAASEGLLAGELRGFQARYVHEGQEWWDTVLALGDAGFRIVRVAQGAA